MEPKPVEVCGRVIRETVDLGSKSERAAVVLRTEEGQRFVLRRNGGPSFGDTSLSSLVGSSIRTSGLAVGQTLIMNQWSQLD